MTTELFRGGNRARLIWAGLCIMVLALLLICRLVPEWRLNPEYRYGFLVPILVGLLLWRSREGMPAAAPREGVIMSIAIFASILGILLVDVIATSNPDWRLVLWVYAALVFFGVVLLFEWAGGWGIWFAGAVALLFFAIPWPSRIEVWAVQGSMRMVASITGEVCNLFGVPVENRGNVLRLESSVLVGVEDACSGVRSLQSSLMAAYFFSRWMWMGWRRSLLLFILAAGLSLFFNLVRAISLTLLAHFKGAGVVDRWHDFAGNSIAVLVFVALMLVSLRLEGERASLQREPRLGRQRWVPVVALAALCCVPLVSKSWFPQRASSEINEVAVAWSGATGNVTYEPVAEKARSLLRYSSGEHGWWQDGDNVRFDLYDFTWGAGLISSFSRIHRPDVCLPFGNNVLAETNA